MSEWLLAPRTPSAGSVDPAPLLGGLTPAGAIAFVRLPARKRGSRVSGCKCLDRAPIDYLFWRILRRNVSFQWIMQTSVYVGSAARAHLLRKGRGALSTTAGAHLIDSQRAAITPNAMESFEGGMGRVAHQETCPRSGGPWRAEARK